MNSINKLWLVNLVKSYNFYLILLLLLFLFTDFQSYKIIYGEDATWINGFLNGDVLKSLFPRGNFLILGGSLPQVISATISSNLSQYALLKYVISYILIFCISLTCFLNKFLSKKTRFLLSVFCFVPLSSSIDFEVFGHLHNLGWYYPVLTINLLFFILHNISEDSNPKKIINIKIFNLIFIIFLFSSCLFPICAVIVLLSQLFFLVIKTHDFNKKLFINNRFLIIFSIIFLFIYLITIQDRSVSIIDESKNNLSFLKYFEFLIRIFNEPFISLFTHSNYFGFYLFMFSSVLIISLMNGLLYLDTFVISVKEFLKLKKQNLNNDLVNFFLLLLFISNIIIFYLTRFPELSFFLSGFTNSSYPERYYLYQNYINTLIIFTILSNNLRKKNLKKSLNNIIVFNRKNYSISFYKFQKKLFTIILYISIVISIINRFGTQFFSNNDYKTVVYSRCESSDGFVVVSGFPNQFKTLIPKNSRYFNHAIKSCNFSRN